MKDDAEEGVSNFYNTVGWETDGETTEDARRWEDLREHARKYVRKCRLRVLRHIPDHGVAMLDMASGPIQYDEYLEYSRNFEKRYCVDLSAGALEKAKKRIGDRGVFWHGSVFDIPMEENFFDCTISLHTIYHIGKESQEEAVRKLLHVTKPGRPVIVVYGNPNTLVSSLRSSIPIRILAKMKRILTGHQNNGSAKEQSPGFYYHIHPIGWWNRFGDVADVKILPWRSFDSDTQKGLIPDNIVGGKMLDVLFSLEERFPHFFVKYFQYPMIILTKRTNRVALPTTAK